MPSTPELSDKPLDYYSQSRPEMLNFIPPTSKRILDVGCGKGAFGGQLKAHLHAKVWGIELDEASGKEAETKIDKVFIGDVFQVLDNIPNNTFDCIILNDILEHLYDPQSLLLRLKEKLSENGVVVSSIPNVRFFYNLRDLVFKKQWRYEDAGVLDRTHIRFFTYKSIAEMYTSIDYEIKTLKGVHPIKRYTLGFNIFNILTFGFFSDTRYLQFACIAKPR